MQWEYAWPDAALFLPQGPVTAPAAPHTLWCWGRVLLAADAHYNKIDESLSMRAGWVSGLHGLLGSGIENLLRCLFVMDCSVRR